MADVNGIRYRLLNGSADWRPRLQGTELVWNEERAVVHLRKRLPRLPDRRHRDVLGLEVRRGAGRDRFGHFWWIDEDRRGLRLATAREPKRNAVAWTVDELLRSGDPAARRGGFRPLEAPRPPLPTLRGLAVTTCDFLVVGTLDPGGFLIFDLHGGGPPTWWRWDDELDVRPLDLAADEDGGVWILDRGAEARLWRLDRYFRVVPLAGLEELTAPRPADFRDVGGTERTLPGRLLPRPVELSAASPPEITEAVAVTALPGGHVLVLESDPELAYSRLHLLRDGEVADTVSFEGILRKILDEDAEPAAENLQGHDVARLGSTLYVAEDDGQQAFAFDLRLDGDHLELDPQPCFLPMRGFTGKALVDAAGGSPPGGELTPPGEVFYDFKDRWLLLTEQPRPRYSPAAEVLLRFDAEGPGAVWHRLLLDACIPPGDDVAVASRAAEDEGLLAQTSWLEEPAPYLRGDGSEVPYHRPWSADELLVAGTGTWELLLQEARGRHLELRLTVRGGGRTTPRIRALRLYGPRFSYLAEYLPAVYREDPASASFLDRYLSNPEGTLTEIEGKVEWAQILFDVDGAPSEALEWLAGWLGASFEPEWDDARRRLFLRHAEELFRWRGTRGGLRRLLRLAVDPCPDERLFDGLGTPEPLGETGMRIVESFLLRRFSGVVLGDPTATEPVSATPGPPHHFTVLVPAVRGETDEERERRKERVATIVEREKPAHTYFDVKLFWELFQVGTARLGLDTQLGEGSRFTALVLGLGHLGETYLTEPHPWNVAERRVLGRDRLAGG